MPNGNDVHDIIIAYVITADTDKQTDRQTHVESGKRIAIAAIHEGYAQLVRCMLNLHTCHLPTDIILTRNSISLFPTSNLLSFFRAPTLLQRE